LITALQKSNNIKKQTGKLIKIIAKLKLQKFIKYQGPLLFIESKTKTLQNK